MNGGVVFAVYDYDAQNEDELSLKCGDSITILRRGDEYEREWWWAAKGDKTGYVPRNLLGVCMSKMANRLEIWGQNRLTKIHLLFFFFWYNLARDYKTLIFFSHLCKKTAAHIEVLP